MTTSQPRPTLRSMGIAPAEGRDWEESAQVLASNSLAGRRAIVTGAGTGIGRGIALRLCELGADVIGMGRREERLAETEELATELAGNFTGISVDLRDAEAAREVISQAAEPGLDILVNNAGGQFYAPFENITDRGFRAVVDLNLNAVFTAISAALPGLSIRGGAIVNMSLTGVDRGTAGIAHSLAARAGVLALTRTIALEWAHAGIRANCIGPGAVLTDDLPPQVAETIKARVLPHAIPAGRATPVEDIAEFTAFLASPAGRFITGQMLQIDGGAHIGNGLHMLDDWQPVVMDQDAHHQ